MRPAGCFCVGAVCAARSMGVAQAQSSTPQVIRMQGYLRDKSRGTPVPANGTYTVEFDLYDAVTGGALVALSGEMPVPVTDGLYEVELPFVHDDFAGAERHIKISIDPDGAGPAPVEVLSPRVRLVVIPQGLTLRPPRAPARGVSLFWARRAAAAREEALGPAFSARARGRQSASELQQGDEPLG